ncbi:hypothetical protein BD289DRAFT_334279, partial [Coniella lustricola]
WALHARSTPRPADYPPISSIPRTKPDRLSRATPKPDVQEPVPASSPLAAAFLADSIPSGPPTVLYLAYGSNLCAKTFLGTRGIRPLSAINVSAPSLRLTFDLPGIAYKEPCFANTAPRKIPKQPRLPPGLPDPPKLPPGFAPPPSSTKTSTKHGAAAAAAAPLDYNELEWDGGLIGVVYEVTAEDYATIVRTEGGGASYLDILVPCIPLPARSPGIPENPEYPELPKPFLAHTLYAPRMPKKPDDGDRDDDDDDDDDDDKTPLDRLKAWWRHLLLQPMRPDPEYAQPSARYLQLLMDGAAEHGLPLPYQRYLASLQPYTITSRLQAVGQFLFLSVAMPVMLLYLFLGRAVAGEDGRVPVWFALTMDTVFHLLWLAYDRLFKPVFGDGERTVEEDEDG